MHVLIRRQAFWDGHRDVVVIILIVDCLVLTRLLLGVRIKRPPLSGHLLRRSRELRVVSIPQSGHLLLVLGVRIWHLSVEMVECLLHVAEVFLLLLHSELCGGRHGR